MPEQYPRTALFGTEERTRFCPTLGREYHLSVALPESYRTSTQAYPVIYVLDAGTRGLQWVVDGYNLAFTALVLAAGSLSDRYGRRPALIIGLLGFAAASVIGAL